jgi:hypothetical protein
MTVRPYDAARALICLFMVFYVSVNLLFYASECGVCVGVFATRCFVGSVDECNYYRETASDYCGC